MKKANKQKDNLYDTLGVKDNVDTPGIKTAYKKLALVSND